MIKAQTEKFLASGGGEIEVIPNGVTGQVSLAGPKHIRLNNNPTPPPTK